MTTLLYWTQGSCVPQGGQTIKRARWNHAATFKAKMAIAALRSDKTLTQLYQQYSTRTRSYSGRSSCKCAPTDLFVTAAKRMAVNGPSVKELHAKTGQLAMKNDFLAGALGRIDNGRTRR